MDEKLRGEADEYRLRTQAEITLLVWVRTSLGLMGFGFVVARFGLFLREIASAEQLHVRPHPYLALLNSIGGTALIALGVVVLLAAVLLHQQFLRRLDRGEVVMPTRWSLAVLLSFALAGLGAGIAVYLALVQF